MQYPNDPELLNELGIDTNRISFSPFIKEYNEYKEEKGQD